MILDFIWLKLPSHYGSEQKKALQEQPSNDSLSHALGSEWMSGTSKQVSATECASEASSAEQAKE